MILITEHAVLAQANGYGAIMLNKPMKCTLCEATHYWFINRHGKTRCVSCDSDYQDGKGIITRRT